MATDIFGASDTVDTLSNQMARLDTITAQFGKSLSKALAGGIVQGKSFEEILRGLGQRLIELSLRAAFKPLESGISSLLGGLTKGVTGLITGGIGGGSITADLFGGGAGKTGIFGGAAMGGAPSAAGITVNMAVTTPNAESFKRSEAQVSAALARAVARGQRSL